MEPDRIVVAGDWHGNTRWAEHVITTASKMLTATKENPGLIVQLGDFGIWPGKYGSLYIANVLIACKKNHMRVWFVDGNHEDFTLLGNFRDGEITRCLRWLPRGYRWIWHGRTWLALGGAVSVDKAVRAEGTSWWPEEEITAAEEALAVSGGHADVMVTHDCPSGVTHSFGRPPSFWDEKDLARSDVHRERLQRVVDKVQPSHLMHGHLHRSYERTAGFAYGPCRVTGLDMDGSTDNFAVLDIKEMTWK